MWTDYNAAYRDALSDGTFLAWREAGARQKAINIVEVCQKIPISSALEIGCGTGSVLRALGSLQFANRYVATDISVAAVESAKQPGGPPLSEAYVGWGVRWPSPEHS